MNDDWDNSSPAVPSKPMIGANGDGGYSFSKGRGFAKIENTNDIWGTNNIGGSGNNWGDTSDRNGGDGWNNTRAYNNKENQVSSDGPRGRGRIARERYDGRGDFKNNENFWGDNDNSNSGFGDNNSYGYKENRGFSDGPGGGSRGGFKSNENSGNGFGDVESSARGRGRGRGRNREYTNSEDTWRDFRNSNNEFDNEEGDTRFGFTGRGSKGGRGRSTNRDDDDINQDFGRGDSSPTKPREIYIPFEVNDENELFKSGIACGINFSKFEKIAVNITGDNVPKPLKDFVSSGLRPILLENIERSNYKNPTPIQKYSIPIILNGRDLMSCAQTGSGKTAAFLLPIIHYLLENNVALEVAESWVAPQAVIVSPTRELAIQIVQQAKKFACNTAIKVVVAYGGTSVQHQRSALQRGCHILVATPGRMLDFVKRGHISFQSIKFVVLDEADRMLDMGFQPSIEEMLERYDMPEKENRQTLMFSATFPEEIQHLAGKYLNNYIFVAVGIVGGACADVEQTFYQVEKFKKRSKLLDILKEDENRTLVFVETKRTADFLATYLCENDIRTTSIHGDRLQREREQALNDFKTGNCRILVSTGVAARGLDINNVKHVINYDLPKDIEEYVHRIGRTGRLGNKGKATSFFVEGDDNYLAAALTRILQQAGQNVPDWLNQSGGSGYNESGFGGSDIRSDNVDFMSNMVSAEGFW